MAAPNIQRIIKVGNSLAVVLPRYLTQALNLKRGDLVKLFCVQEGVVSVRKVNEEDLNEEPIEIIKFNS